MLSDLQKMKLKKAFRALDGDGDGYAQPDDSERLAKRVASVRGLAEGGPDYQRLLELYQDAGEALVPYEDDQRRVDFDAYLKFHNKILNIPGGYRIVVSRLADFIFDVLDADGDGMISVDEVRMFYKAYSIDARHAPTAFEMMDVDEDGQLSKDEIRDAVAQFYFSSDPDARGNWLMGPLDD